MTLSEKYGFVTISFLKVVQKVPQKGYRPPSLGHIGKV